MELRKLTAGSLAQMLELEARCGLEPYSEEMLLDCVEHLYSLGAFDGERLAGFITVNGSSQYLGGSVYIVNLNVAEEYRRRGIATALIREGCRAFRGKPLVTLDVLRSNPAMALYRKLGFAQIDLPSRNGDGDVVMAVPMERLLLEDQSVL